MIIELLLIGDILADFRTYFNDSALDSIVEEFNEIQHGAESSCNDDGVWVFSGYLLESFNGLFCDIYVFDVLNALDQNLDPSTVHDSITAIW